MPTWSIAVNMPRTVSPTDSLALSYHARGDRLLVGSGCRLGWFWIGGLGGSWVGGGWFRGYVPAFGWGRSPSGWSARPPGPHRPPGAAESTGYVQSAVGHC